MFQNLNACLSKDQINYLRFEKGLRCCILHKFYDSLYYKHNNNLAISIIESNSKIGLLTILADINA